MVPSHSTSLSEERVQFNDSRHEMPPSYRLFVIVYSPEQTVALKSNGVDKQATFNYFNPNVICFV